MQAENATMHRIFPIACLIVGCKAGSVGLGKGSDPDARLVAELYTWPCSSGGTTDSGATTTEDIWEGVFNYRVSLEYAPDALADRSIPASGCVAGADLFARDAGAGATDIPGIGEPSWANGDQGGPLNRQSPGFYAATVLDNEHSCQQARELLGEGTLLSDAGPFSGARSPQPGTYDSVTLSGEVSSVSGLEFGATVDASWDASDWDSAWVQVRRENAGALVESVTCNAGTASSFTIDDAVWSLMSSAIQTDVTNLYVAVQNTSSTETEDGQEIEVVTRAMHVAVVQD